jgi:hypothetical protein
MTEEQGQAWTWDRVLAETVPPETTVPICLRGDLVAAKEEAERQLVVLRQRNPDPTVGEGGEILAAAERVQHLEEECAAAAVTFRFRGIGRRAHSDLEAQHPPTPEQQAEGEEQGIRYRWNPTSFPAALVAASCVEPPGITLDAARRISEDWTDGQWMTLWRACITANEGVADPGPKSVIASAVLRGSEQS